MTEDLRARIECALGLHPVIRNGQTVPLTNAVMEIVQPIADECDQLRARVAELERHQGAAVTNHTYEGAPGSGNPCQAEAFGETCGAAWEQHEMRDRDEA